MNGNSFAGEQVLYLFFEDNLEVLVGHGRHFCVDSPMHGRQTVSFLKTHLPSVIRVILFPAQVKRHFQLIEVNVYVLVRNTMILVCMHVVMLFKRRLARCSFVEACCNLIFVGFWYLIRHEAI